MATAHAFIHRSTDSSLFRKPRHLVLFAIAPAANWIPTTAGQADESILTWIVPSISSADENDIVVLVNGRDLVTIGPKSVVTVGDNDATTPVGNLGLSGGTVRVEVGERKPGHTFSVDGLGGGLGGLSGLRR